MDPQHTHKKPGSAAHTRNPVLGVELAGQPAAWSNWRASGSVHARMRVRVHANKSTAEQRQCMKDDVHQWPLRPALPHSLGEAFIASSCALKHPTLAGRGRAFVLSCEGVRRHATLTNGGWHEILPWKQAAEERIPSLSPNT